MAAGCEVTGFGIAFAGGGKEMVGAPGPAGVIGKAGPGGAGGTLIAGGAVNVDGTPSCAAFGGIFRTPEFAIGGCAGICIPFGTLCGIY